MSTIINSNQIRQSGDTSHQTLINESQIRASGDTSSETLINPNQVEEISPYQPVNYIQSTGGQYIDTGIYPDDTTIIQAKFIMTNYNGYVFIGYYSSDSDNFRLFTYSSNTYLDYGNSSNGRISTSKRVGYNEVGEIEYGNLYIKDLVTGNILASGTPISFSERNKTIKMFDNNNYGKMFYLKIKKQNSWVADYVPVYDTQTQKYGMYDRVSQTFKGNDGTGNFTGGGEAKFKTSIYTEGNAYISLDLSHLQSQSIKCRLKGECLNFSELYYLFGFYSGAQYDSYQSFFDNGSVSVAGSSQAVSISSPNFDLTGNAITMSSSYLSDFRLFSWKSGSTINFTSGKCKFSLFEILDSNDNILHQLKPAIVNGESGMYDTVTATFYGNANSVGSLVCE